MSDARPPTHLGAVMRLLMRGVSAGGPGAGHAEAPRRRRAVERSGMRIDPRRLARYLATTGWGGVEGRVPPSFASSWETALAIELFGEGELPVPTGGLMVVESERVVLRPVRPDDRIRCRVEIDRVEPHARGRKVFLEARNWNAAGQLCQESAMCFLTIARDAQAPRGRERPRADAGDAWRRLDEWTLRGDLGRRFARASGDYNPIHLWSWSSRLLGFARPVLQGYCIEAMLERALAERLTSGDLHGLRRLQVRFRRPVPLPSAIVLDVSGGESGGAGRFRIASQTSPEEALAEGSFVLA